MSSQSFNTKKRSLENLDLKNLVTPKIVFSQKCESLPGFAFREENMFPQQLVKVALALVKNI
jgi:hypothetical protein